MNPDTKTPLTDAEVKLVGMLGEHLVGVGLCRRLEQSNADALAALKPVVAYVQAVKNHAPLAIVVAVLEVQAALERVHQK